MLGTGSYRARYFVHQRLAFNGQERLRPAAVLGIYHLLHKAGVGLAWATAGAKGKQDACHHCLTGPRKFGVF